MKRNNVVAAIALSVVVARSLPAQTSTAAAPAPPAVAAAAVVPQALKFSGTLLDADGKPMAGPVSVTFALYSEQTGGAALWMETQNVTPDANGHYTVVLGAESSGGVPSDLFASGQPRWLGMQADQKPELPRVLLVSVPYAMKAADADTLGGRPASAYMVAPSGDVDPDWRSHHDHDHHLTGEGTPGFFALFTDRTELGNSTLFESDGLVGLGTTKPMFALDVHGTGNFTGAVTFGSPVTFAPGQGFPGTGTISGVTAGTGLMGGGTSGMVTLNLNTGFTDARYAQLGTANMFAGNITAPLFTGSGAGLTALNPANLSGGTAGINITGNAATASNALLLGGMPASAFVLTGAPTNTFTGGATFGGPVGIGTLTPSGLFEVAGNMRVSGVGSTLNVGGNIVVSGATTASVHDGTLAVTQGGADTAAVFSCSSSAPTGCLPLQINVNSGQKSLSVVSNGSEVAIMDSQGLLQIEGLILANPFGVNMTTPSPGPVPIEQGASSPSLDLVASSFNSATALPAPQNFRFQVAPVNSNSSSPSGQLNLLFGQNGAVPLPTGLSVASNGIITFAAGQTFPVAAGGGTVTQVNTGTGLLGGPITGSGTISLDTSKVPLLGMSNTFSGSITTTAVPGFIGDGSMLSSVNALTLGGNLPSAFASTGSNAFNGNQTITGGLTVSGNLGVGTATPAATLDVNGTINAATQFNLGGLPFAFGAPYDKHMIAGGNVYLGFAGNPAGTGNKNTGVGWEALASITSGFGNSAFGSQALSANTIGQLNSAFGNGALESFTGSTGMESNTALGSFALDELKTGSNNIAVGWQAGENLLGAESSDIYIGNKGVVTESNTIRLGDPTVHTTTYLAGKVGIGTTTTPVAILDVEGNGTAGPTLEVGGNATITGNLNVTGAVTCGSGCSGGGGGSGTVTSITAGAGLTATSMNPITSTGTISLDTYTCPANQALIALPAGTCASFATTGTNTFNGPQTVIGNLISTGLITATTGFSTTGSFSASGLTASTVNATSSYNLFGLGVLKTTSTTTDNVYLGFSSGNPNAFGFHNVGLGSGSLASGMGGTGNTGVGVGSGAMITSGSYNTHMGYSAGSVSSGEFSFSSAIGAFADVEQNYSMVLGSIPNVNGCLPSSNPPCLATKVGIGTTKPISILDVEANNPGTLAPLLTLTNSGSQPGQSLTLDFNTLAPSSTGTYNPTVRMQVTDDGSNSGTIQFLANKQGAANNGLNPTAAIDALGNLVTAGSVNTTLLASQTVLTETAGTNISLTAQSGTLTEKAGTDITVTAGGTINETAAINMSLQAGGSISMKGGGGGTLKLDGSGATLGGPVITIGSLLLGIPLPVFQSGLTVTGDLTVGGNLSKGSGSFKIDDPIDPANKYLYHSFVESPDMMNVYNGNIVTDERGYATVVLPEYFEALNRDFRYQLTVIGQFAQAIVEKEISGNRFVIRTDKPAVKVSWQVTGIRQDAYANAHRIPNEELKPAEEQGHYLHPELFGAPPEMSVAAAHRAAGAQAKGTATQPASAKDKD